MASPAGSWRASAEQTVADKSDRLFYASVLTTLAALMDVLVILFIGFVMGPKLNEGNVKIKHNNELLRENDAMMRDGLKRLGTIQDELDRIETSVAAIEKALKGKQ